MMHFRHPKRLPEQRHLKAACGNAAACPITFDTATVTCAGCRRTVGVPQG